MLYHFDFFVQVWCTPRRAVYVVIIICTSAFLITFPEFFECRIVVEQSSSASNRSNYSSADTQQVILRPVPTEFGASVGYRLGYSYVNQSLFTFLPLILLFIFNSLLVKAVLSAARLRKAMTSANVVSIRPDKFSCRHNMTEYNTKRQKIPQLTVLD